MDKRPPRDEPPRGGDEQGAASSSDTPLTVSLSQGERGPRRKAREGESRAWTPESGRKGWHEEARRFSAALRRLDPLAWAGLAGAFILLTFPVYWLLASVLPLFGGSEGHAADFLIYSRAGHRVWAEPLTLYADPSFLYPPPSAVLFALAVLVPMGWGYVLQAAVNVGALAVCVRLGEKLHSAPPRGWVRAALWCAAFASAPALQNMKYGQVNVLVLALALGYLLLLRKSPARGGALLALGFWLKLYPAVLGVLALRKGRLGAVAGAVVAGLLVPLVLLPLFPADLYLEYLREKLPTIAGGTTTSTLNAGIPAIVERLGQPAEALLTYRAAPFGTAASWAGRLVLVGGVAAATVAWVRGWSAEAAGVTILLVVAVSSSFGWEYTFVLAMPAALACLLVAREAGTRGRLVSILAMAALLLQKPPEAVMRWAVESVPDPLLDAFAARFVLALVALGAVAWGVRRRGGTVPDSASL